ncbi:MAG: hypothetical protein AB7H86_16750 [Blastocatellales bacterium]
MNDLLYRFPLQGRISIRTGFIRGRCLRVHTGKPGQQNYQRDRDGRSHYDGLFHTFSPSAVVELDLEIKSLIFDCSTGYGVFGKRLCSWLEKKFPGNHVLAESEFGL